MPRPPRRWGSGDAVLSEPIGRGEDRFVQNVRSGFLTQWGHLSTWLVAAVAIGAAVLIGWYLVRSRQWPAWWTGAALGWSCIIIASTWRLREALLDWRGVLGPDGLIPRMGSAQEWQRAAELLTNGEPFFLADVLLFSLAAVLWVMASRRLWLAILVGVALTLLVEAQQALSRGRVELLDDVLAGVIGTVVGSVIGVLFRWAFELFARERETAQ